MAKKFFFALLLCAFPIASNWMFAGNGNVLPEKTFHKIDDCNAPPPDSFRVVGMNADGVTLSWLPEVLESTHNIVLFIEEINGTWTTLETYPSVSGNSHTFVGLGVGSYKARIRTNCPSGGLGPGWDDVVFRIIDLMTAGRVPVNPQPITCNQIDYLNHEWVGFSVKELATGRTNLFEFDPDGTFGHIRRLYNNPIVAVDENGDFPTNGTPPLQVSFTFQIDDKSKSTAVERRIGFVEFSQTSSFIIGLCKDLDNPVQWKSGYEFTALTAEATILNQGGGAGLVRPNYQETFLALSPFSDNLTIFSPESITKDTEATVFLFDSNGQLILSQVFNLTNSQNSISTEHLHAGVYFLQIRTENETQTLKAIKPK